MLSIRLRDSALRLLQSLEKKKILPDSVYQRIEEEFARGKN